MPAPLLQELYWPDPWKCMVICIMLNCTQRKQVEPMIDGFFAKFPDALTYCERYQTDDGKQEIIETIRSLGFYNRRAARIFGFSRDMINKQGFGKIRELYGIGEYAARCYEMLFLGQFGDEPPNDHALKDYWHWFVEKHGPSYTWYERVKAKLPAKE